MTMAPRWFRLLDEDHRPTGVTAITGGGGHLSSGCSVPRAASAVGSGIIEVMTLPPGHYGRAGRERAQSRTPSPAVAPLSWRWFLPRSRRRRRVAAALTVVLALSLSPGGYAGEGWVGGFGMIHLLVSGVALRRVVPLGRMWRRDPAGAAHFADERSHIYAVVGTVIVAGALAAALLTTIAASLLS